MTPPLTPIPTPTPITNQTQSSIEGLPVPEGGKSGVQQEFRNTKNSEGTLERIAGLAVVTKGTHPQHKEFIGTHADGRVNLPSAETNEILRRLASINLGKEISFSELEKNPEWMKLQSAPIEEKAASFDKIVSKFQEKHHIRVDGVVGPETLGVIKNLHRSINKQPSNSSTADSRAGEPQESIESVSQASLLNQDVGNMVAGATAYHFAHKPIGKILRSSTDRLKSLFTRSAVATVAETAAAETTALVPVASAELVAGTAAAETAVGVVGASETVAAASWGSRLMTGGRLLAGGLAAAGPTVATALGVSTPIGWAVVGGTTLALAGAAYWYSSSGNEPSEGAHQNVAAQ